MSKYRTISLSILSGKGGVGKSNLALNICYALHQMKHPVLLIDCDMGLANMDVLLGIAPQQHIQDILISNRNPAEVLVPIGVAGGSRFDLMPANTGMAEFVELDAGARALLREKINPLASNYDFVCLDIGAGISATAIGFSAMTTLRIVIITPEPTSLTDSYAVMKMLSARHKVRDFHVLVNQVESAAEGKQAYNRLSAVCKRFLGFSPAYLGEIRSDRNVTEAVRKQKPFMQLSPLSPAAVDCMAAANVLQRLRDNILRTEEVPAPLKDFAVHDF
jgi:flagellar biosynthesis protein FlhG